LLSHFFSLLIAISTPTLRGSTCGSAVYTHRSTLLHHHCLFHLAIRSASHKFRPPCRTFSLLLSMLLSFSTISDISGFKHLLNCSLDKFLCCIVIISNFNLLQLDLNFFFVKIFYVLFLYLYIVHFVWYFCLSLCCKRSFYLLILFDILHQTNYFFVFLLFLLFFQLLHLFLFGLCSIFQLYHLLLSILYMYCYLLDEFILYFFLI